MWTREMMNINDGLGLIEIVCVWWGGGVCVTYPTETSDQENSCGIIVNL